MQRYLTLKDMTPAERKKVNKKVVFFAGKAAPACEFYVRNSSRTLILPQIILPSSWVASKVSKWFTQSLIDHSSDCQRCPHHQCRPRYKGVSVTVLLARLLCLLGRDSHTSLWYQSTHIHGWYRGIRHLKHEVLSQWRSPFGHCWCVDRSFGGGRSGWSNP